VSPTDPVAEALEAPGVIGEPHPPSLALHVGDEHLGRIALALDPKLRMLEAVLVLPAAE